MRISHVAVMTALLALSPTIAFSRPMMFHRAIKMQVSPDVPAAQGKVKYDKSDNGNISIQLEVRYLAEPQKLQPTASVYVVWVSADKDSPAQNIGALIVDNQRKGILKSTTPLQSFELFVTAETNGQIQAPTGQRLLWTDHNSE